MNRLQKTLLTLLADGWLLWCILAYLIDGYYAIRAIIIANYPAAAFYVLCCAVIHFSYNLSR